MATVRDIFVVAAHDLNNQRLSHAAIAAFASIMRSAYEAPTHQVKRIITARSSDTTIVQRQHAALDPIDQQHADHIRYLLRVSPAMDGLGANSALTIRQAVTSALTRALDAKAEAEARAAARKGARKATTA